MDLVLGQSFQTTKVRLPVVADPLHDVGFFGLVATLITEVREVKLHQVLE